MQDTAGAGGSIAKARPRTTRHATREDSARSIKTKECKFMPVEPPIPQSPPPETPVPAEPGSPAAPQPETPPPEAPPMPSQPAQPEPVPTEIPAPMPNIDIPSPSTQPMG